MIYTNKEILNSIIKDKDIGYRKYYRFVLEDYSFMFIEFFLISTFLYFLFNLYRYLVGFIVITIVILVYFRMIDIYKKHIYQKYEVTLYTNCDYEDVFSSIALYLNKHKVVRKKYYVMLLDCLFEYERYEMIDDILSEFLNSENYDDQTKISLLLRKIRLCLFYKNESHLLQTYEELCSIKSFDFTNEALIINVIIEFFFQKKYNIELIASLKEIKANCYLDSYLQYIIGCMYEKLHLLDESNSYFYKVESLTHNILCKKLAKDKLDGRNNEK